MPIISDTALRVLLPPQLKVMTIQYKQMCGCKIFIVMKNLQASLNQYRQCLLREMWSANINGYTAYLEKVYRDGKLIHQTAKDALLSIQCPPRQKGLFQMKCAT